MTCRYYKKIDDAEYRGRRIHEGWCKRSRETVSCRGDIAFCEVEEGEESSDWADDEPYEALTICEPKWVYFQSGLVKCARYDFAEARLEVELKNGETYFYQRVPEEVYFWLINSADPTEYFFKEIKYYF